LTDMLAKKVEQNGKDWSSPLIPPYKCPHQYSIQSFPLYSMP